MLLQKPSISIAILLQACLVIIVFWRVLFQPDRYLLPLFADGVKNYFTYKSYINQVWSDDYLLFKQFNYPFGEMVSYTDNTPLLAVPLKIFCHYIWDISDYLEYIYHSFILSGVVISTLFLYLILQRFVSTQWLVLVFSVLLPWVNPQMGRLFIGQFNLSFSWVPLMNIWFLMCIFQRVNEVKRIWNWALIYSLIQFVLSFIHLYYLVIQIMFTGYFLFFWIVYNSFKRKNIIINLLCLGVVCVLVPLVMTLLVMKELDPLYYNRKSVASGYFEWRHDIATLITTPIGRSIKFIFYNKYLPWYETVSYLGTFCLWGGVVWIFWVIININSGVVASKILWINHEYKTFLKILVCTALGCLFISLGEKFIITEKIEITNYLNAFRYLRLFIPNVTQFRSLGRFSWVVFWVCQILTVCMLDSFIREKPSKLIKGVVVILMGIAVVDSGDAMLTLRMGQYMNSLTSSSGTYNIKQLLNNVNCKKYQAILPIPYYHVGSEVQNFTIHPVIEMKNASIQASLISGLPLMSSDMSRTPPFQAKALCSLFTNEELPIQLKNRLSKKPIMVLYNRILFKKISKSNLSSASNALLHSINMPQKFGMKLLKVQGDWKLYSWNPKVGNSF